MPDFTTNEQGLMTGVTQGMQLGMQARQQQIQAQQLEQEKQIKIQQQKADSMKSTIELIKTFKSELPDEYKLKLLNERVMPVLYGDIMGKDPTSIPKLERWDDKVGEAVGKVSSLLEKGKKAKYPPQVMQELLITTLAPYEDEIRKRFEGLIPAQTTDKVLGIKEAAGGRAASSPTSIMGKLLTEFLQVGLDKMDPQKQALINKYLTDPTIGSMIQVYKNSPQNLGKSAEQQATEILDLSEAISKESNNRRGINPPPARTAGVGGVASPHAPAAKTQKYATPEEVQAAYMNGEVTEDQATKLLQAQWPDMFK